MLFVCVLVTCIPLVHWSLVLCSPLTNASLLISYNHAYVFIRTYMHMCEVVGRDKLTLFYWFFPSLLGRKCISCTLLAYPEIRKLISP